MPGIKACDSVILSDLLKFLEKKHFVCSVKIFQSIGHNNAKSFWVLHLHHELPPAGELSCHISRNPEF